LRKRKKSPAEVDDEWKLISYQPGSNFLFEVVSITQWRSFIVVCLCHCFYLADSKGRGGGGALFHLINTFCQKLPAQTSHA